MPEIRIAGSARKHQYSHESAAEPPEDQGITCIKCGRSLYVDNADAVGQLDETGTVITECWHAYGEEETMAWYLCNPVEGIDKHWDLDNGGQYLHHP